METCTIRSRFEESKVAFGHRTQLIQYNTTTVTSVCAEMHTHSQDCGIKTKEFRRTLPARKIQ